MERRRDADRAVVGGGQRNGQRDVLQHAAGTPTIASVSAALEGGLVGWARTRRTGATRPSVAPQAPEPIAPARSQPILPPPATAGDRFDDLARSVAAGRSRRGFLAGLAGLAVGIFGGGRGRMASAACPPDQKLGASNRCLCRTSGRPPGVDGCPCASGRRSG